MPRENNVEVATSNHELTPPHIGKTFLDIHGGSIVYAYGGGNNATVTEKTVISLDNPSKVVNSIKDTRITTENDGELLTNDRFENQMDINTTFSYPSSAEYQIGRLFGGNNKADMAIRPLWNLQRGRVRSLYGGGNEGRMTSQEGLKVCSCRLKAREWWLITSSVVVVRQMCVRSMLMEPMLLKLISS